MHKDDLKNFRYKKTKNLEMTEVFTLNSPDIHITNDIITIFEKPIIFIKFPLNDSLTALDLLSFYLSSFCTSPSDYSFLTLNSEPLVFENKFDKGIELTLDEFSLWFDEIENLLEDDNLFKLVVKNTNIWEFLKQTAIYEIIQSGKTNNERDLNLEIELKRWEKQNKN